MITPEKYVNSENGGASHMEMKKNYSKKFLFSVFIAITLVLASGVEAQKKQPEVPYVPTPVEVVMKMLEMANVGKNDILYDLGCGDGRIVITAVKEFGCRGVGVDIDPKRIRESQANAIEAGVSDKVQFIEMDLFEAKISDASVVTLYLLSEVNLRLRPKLLRELKPGTRVVSHEFSMGEWDPDARTAVKTEDEYWQDYPENNWSTHNVLFWIIPGNVTGTWNVTIPDISEEKNLSLQFDQEFQMVSGKAFEGKRSIPLFIKDGKINGDVLQFTLERKTGRQTEKMHFEGKVKGETMQGTLNIEGRPGRENIRWRAKRVVSTYSSINIPD
jgi:SAM-dependent methyltransferase